jgi:hypothetical protein
MASNEKYLLIRRCITEKYTIEHLNNFSGYESYILFFT